MNIISFICLFLCISVTLSCKCKQQTTKESFCNAEWVSHVKVKVRISKQPLPSDSSRKGLNNLKYAVEHFDVYKKPSNLTALPTEIFTPSESPACGLLIEAGKEYLLAGRLDGTSLYTVLCGQVLSDDKSATSYENVLEWKNVPSSLSSSLSSIKC